MPVYQQENTQKNNQGSSDNSDYANSGVICRNKEQCQYVLKGKCRYNHPWLDSDPNYRGDVYVMLHGTNKKNLQSIQQNGFQQSSNKEKMMLGIGVYFTCHLEKAKNYGDIIFIVQVRVGKSKRIEHDGQEMQKTWHENGYDSAYVPQGTKFSKKGFSEVCIYDPKNIKIIKYGSYEELKNL